MEFVKNMIYKTNTEISDDNLKEFNDSLFIYETAMKILNTKLGIIESEYDRDKMHNDLQGIKCRIKSRESILKKLEKNGHDFSIENIEKYLNDVVGARIICLTEDDVYSIVKMIKSVPSIRVIQEKDYIANPKESGYRSYHIIIEIDVPLVNGQTVPVRAEIQVRTILMDAWSSLEHEIIYKNKECTEESKNRLRDYSYELAFVEKNMSQTRERELTSGDDVKVRHVIDSKELKNFKENLYIYDAASMILESYIDIIKSEYDSLGNYSDIQNIRFRTKSIESIDEKLVNNNLEFTLDNIRDSIKDVIAARIVCLDLEDVKKIVDLLTMYPGINIIESKDYITFPKESGYRSHHLIVEIPVELSSGTINVKAEIQVRTILMDAWAALEHETIYKNRSCSDESRQMLRTYSYILSSMDHNMVGIKKTEVSNLTNLADDDVKKRVKSK